MKRLLVAVVVWSALSAGARADSAIPVKTLRRLKAATVFIKADFGRLKATGSGFVMKVDGTTGYVVTNHHVISLPPRFRVGPPKLTLVFHSGTRQEKSVPAEIVASEPGHDLAILKVTGIKKFPRPVDISKQPDLVETMTVFMFGFPFGKALSSTRGNPGITVGKGSVSSIRLNEREEVAAVQIEGALNPGNSGGPVVDADGHLIGVAVAKITGTNIGLAIPTAHLLRMIDGRVASAELTTVKVGAGRVEIRVVVRLIDPLHKIKKVTLNIVRQELLKGKLKADAKGLWKQLPDSQSMFLKIDKETATGYISIPVKGAKELVLAHQAGFVDGRGQTRFTQPGSFRTSTTKVVAISPKDWKTDPKGPKGKVTNETQLAKTYTFADLKVTELKLEAGKLLPCMFWDKGGKVFYCADSNGVIRRIRLDGFKEELKLDVDGVCNWLCLSKEGLVLTVSGSQEVWLLDKTTLKVKGKMSVGGVTRALSSPSLSMAYAVGQNGLTVLDLKKGKGVKAYSNRDLGQFFAFRHAAITPNGKYLFTQGGLEQLLRFKLDGADVKLEEMSPRIAANGQTIVVSPDSAYVALPSGGGNYQPLKDHPKVGPYSTYIYKVTDIKRAAKAISSGAYPRALAFDSKAGLFYAQNFQKQLIIFSQGGIKKKEYQLGGGDPKQFLAHPQGRKLLLLTAQKLFYVELPAK
jgi:S1-C subfamily serine protease